MKKLFSLIVLTFCILSCANAHMKKETKIYHIVFLEKMDISSRVDYFNPKTITYIGKMIVKNRSNSVEYLCLSEVACQKFKETANLYLRKDEEGYILSVRYSLFYPKKPKKQKEMDYIEYLPFDKLWLLGRTATYGDKDFWLAFETRGFYNYLPNGGFYRAIDPEVGEKYFKEKRTGTGDIELQNGLKLTHLESFYKE